MSASSASTGSQLGSETGRVRSLTFCASTSERRKLIFDNRTWSAAVAMEQPEERAAPRVGTVRMRRNKELVANWYLELFCTIVARLARGQHERLLRAAIAR
jgi:hypothetical protein